MEKIDFKKSLKSLYRATGKIQEIEAGQGQFLVIAGQGEPGGEAFQKALEKLYGMVYTLKFSLKNAGVLDFAVCSLEGLYCDDPREVPKDLWSWRMLTRVPDEVNESQVEDARSALKARKQVDASDVKLETLREGRSVQVLHVGPYDQVGATYEQIEEYLLQNELSTKGAAHEIYLNDPRRNPPERLKTIIRLPVG